MSTEVYFWTEKPRWAIIDNQPRLQIGTEQKSGVSLVQSSATRSGRMLYIV